jgi:hypothetical protein
MLPAQIVIMNKDLVSRLGSHETFKYNQNKLVSRLDWFLTLKHLAVVPYGNVKIDSNLYNH